MAVLDKLGNDRPMKKEHVRFRSSRNSTLMHYSSPVATARPMKRTGASWENGCKWAARQARGGGIKSKSMVTWQKAVPSPRFHHGYIYSYIRLCAPMKNARIIPTASLTHTDALPAITSTTELARPAALGRETTYICMYITRFSYAGVGQETQQRFLDVV